MFKDCCSCSNATSNIAHDCPLLHHYYDKLIDGNNAKFNPVIVQTKDEMQRVILDLSANAPVIVESIKLGEGLTFNDPFLMKGMYKLVSVEQEKLPRGVVGNIDIGKAGLVDYDVDILPKHWVPEKHRNKQVRTQVLSSEFANLSKINAEIQKERGESDCLKAYEYYRNNEDPKKDCYYCDPAAEPIADRPKQFNEELLNSCKQYLLSTQTD